MPLFTNRRFPEITGEDNLTVFSYSRRVKSPEWRWQRKRAYLRYFEIFRHGPIIIYTRLPAGGTYYPICTFPASSECLIGISDAFSAFCYVYPSSSPRAHCIPNKSATPAGMDLDRQVHARRLLPSAVPWISEGRLLPLLHLIYVTSFVQRYQPVALVTFARCAVIYQPTLGYVC